METTTVTVAVASRWAERTGSAFTVRGVLSNGAVSVMFDGGWPLTLAVSEVSKWTSLSFTATNSEFVVAA